MSNPPYPPATAPRDGTSQSGRFLRDLDPASVRVDERGTRDLLAFAQAYARELRYFPADGPGGEASATDWRGFFAGVDIEQAVAYLQAPESFTAEQAAPYARPHFALFLAFLKLLDQGRGQLNTFTRRHLEFFYRDVLRMTPKPAVPDRVHVLVDLDTATPRLALPAGTALLAGKDRLDRDLVYRTGRELVASPVAVAQVRSLHAEISVTRINGACPANLDDAHRPAGFMEMMKIALGQPNPGDPLPVDLGAKPPRYPGVPPATTPANKLKPQVGFAELVAAAALIARVEGELGMPSFDDYRELVRLRRQRRLQDAADWTAINDTLVAAGRLRDAAFDIQPRSASQFNANVEAALGKSIEDLFSELEEVATMEDAYAALVTRRAEVSETLAQALAPLALDGFESMMQVKTRIDLEWGRIDALLEAAGRHLNPGFNPAALRAANGFEAKLAAALPKFSFTGGFDAYHDAFTSVETYFYMSAEGYRFIMSLATRPAGPVADDWGWQKAHEIVEAAHREMVYAQRRDALRRVAQPGIAAGAPLQALGDMLADVLGENLRVELALKELYPPPATVPAVLAAIAGNPGSAPDWDHAVQVLEIAQRNWQNFKDPTPERVEWRNLHPAADATAVLAQTAQAGSAPSDAADAQALPRWKTFGRAEVSGADDPPPPVLGWAIESPLLALAEGQRSIVLTLGFDADPTSFDLGEIRRLFASDNPAGAGRPLQALLSTAKGWLEPDSFRVAWAEPQMAGYPKVPDTDTSQLRALVFTFTLAKGQPALVPLVHAVHGMATQAPVLRLMMRPYWDGARHSTRYATLRKLRLVRTHLAVTVQGLERFLLQNDDGVLNSTKPFEPFGVVPAVGSRLYLGHPEIVGKPLTSLQFNLTWMGVPDNDLGAHYARYEQGLANTSFKAVVALADDGVLRPFSPASAPAPAAGADPAAFGSSLFDAVDARKPVAMPLRPPPNLGRPDLARTAADDVTEWNRHLVCELTPTDFQHAVYPKTAVKQSLAMAADIASRPAGGGAVDASKYLVNTPYTPKLKSLTLDYGAATEFALAARAGALPPAARSFHVHPFGHAGLEPEGTQAWCTFLPAYDFEGELCIGLRNVKAPQNLSLLFQVAEGSANPDVAPEPLQWSYLDGNRWRSLHEGGLLGDTSRGLINTGIVELALPAAAPSTLLPDDLYWIRAAIPRASQGVCDIVRIHPNAVLAVFDDDGNAPEHLAVPLAPQSIKAPLLPTPGVAALRQPYTSFGGKTPEQPADFNVRVSERLRHKRRALTIWDYERLVLEKFPQIYKVKCLRADPAAHPRDPGRIVLVVIPDIRNRLPFNPFEPKVPADQIRDIEAFLRDKTPPFASVEVRNASYVPVKVRCGVRFLPGRDEGHCRQRLTDELNRFLSPWAYDEGADIVIGGSLYANSIINFIDQRDYVDYIAGFKLFTGDDDVFVPEPAEGGYRASTNRPDGVLVAARQHRFDVIPDADYRVEEFTGINYMMVELDFIPA